MDNDSNSRTVSLEKSFSYYIDNFFPELNDLKLNHYKEGECITFYLQDKKRKTYFVFYYFENLGYGRDLSCPLNLVYELEKYFDLQSESLLLDWFINKYEITVKRLIPTDLVKRI